MRLTSVLLAAPVLGASVMARGDSPAEIETLDPGQVFGLMIDAPGKDSDKAVIKVYGDSTMGIKDPYNPDARPFRGVYMPEYGVLLQPVPLQCVKLDYQNVLLVNDSMYGVSKNVKFDQGSMAFETPLVLCPSWNDVIVQPNTTNAPCTDGYEVKLRTYSSAIVNNL